MQKYSDIEILATLVAYADRTTGLPRKVYESTRTQNDPSAPLIEGRFGTWNNALRAAGIRTITEQPPQLQGAVHHWEDHDIVSALIRCRDEAGSLSVNIYQRWRRQLEDPTSVPSLPLIRLRFRWSEIIKAID